MENFVDEWIINPLHNALHGEEYFSMKVMRNVLAHCKEEDGMDVFHEKGNNHPIVTLFPTNEPGCITLFLTKENLIVL